MPYKYSRDEHGEQDEESNLSSDGSERGLAKNQELLHTEIGRVVDGAGAAERFQLLLARTLKLNNQ